MKPRSSRVLGASPCSRRSHCTRFFALRGGQTAASSSPSCSSTRSSRWPSTSSGLRGALLHLGNRGVLSASGAYTVGILTVPFFPVPAELPGRGTKRRSSVSAAGRLYVASTARRFCASAGDYFALVTLGFRAHPRSTRSATSTRSPRATKGFEPDRGRAAAGREGRTWTSAGVPGERRLGGTRWYKYPVPVLRHFSVRFGPAFMVLVAEPGSARDFGPRVGWRCAKDETGFILHGAQTRRASKLAGRGAWARALAGLAGAF